MPSPDCFDPLRSLSRLLCIKGALMYSQCDPLRVRMNREQCCPVIAHNQWGEGLPGCKSLKSFDDVSFRNGMEMEATIHSGSEFSGSWNCFLNLESPSGKSTAMNQPCIMKHRSALSSGLLLHPLPPCLFTCNGKCFPHSFRGHCRVASAWPSKTEKSISSSRSNNEADTLYPAASQ